MKNVPNTFGGISKKMLQMVIQLKVSRINVVFDQYFTMHVDQNMEAWIRQHCATVQHYITSTAQLLIFIRGIINNFV